MKQGFFVALLAIALGGIGTYAVGQPLLDGNPLAMLGNVKSNLKLNTSQQLQWDAVVAQTKAAHDAGRANFEQLKTALQAELAKAEPDLLQSPRSPMASAVSTRLCISRRAMHGS